MLHASLFTLPAYNGNYATQTPSPTIQSIRKLRISITKILWHDYFGDNHMPAISKNIFPRNCSIYLSGSSWNYFLEKSFKIEKQVFILQLSWTAAQQAWTNWGSKSIWSTKKYFFLFWWSSVIKYLFNPPGSEASKEVVNLTERKNLHTPLYGVKEFVHLSVYYNIDGFTVTRSVLVLI